MHMAPDSNVLFVKWSRSTYNCTLDSNVERSQFCGQAAARSGGRPGRKDGRTDSQSDGRSDCRMVEQSDRWRVGWTVG